MGQVLRNSTAKVTNGLNPLSPQSSKSASVLFPIVSDTGFFPFVLNCVFQGQSITSNSDPICGTFS